MTMNAGTELGDLTTVELLLGASELLVIALGLTISYIAYVGYRRNDSRPMLFFSAGFILVVGVPAVAGSLFVFGGVGSELLAGGVSQLATIAGMVAILYALRTSGPSG